MKTKLMIIAGIVVFLGITMIPAATVHAAVNNGAAFDNAADNPLQMQCNGQQKGNQSGPRDGTKGANAPRDGRGKGNGSRDGNGNGARRGQGGGPRDGSGPGCQKG